MRSANVMDRRLFGVSALAFVAACSVDDMRLNAHPRFKANPFMLGVASGDPTSSGFVIWTRLVDDALDERPVIVSWEVAEDETFRHIVRTGRHAAERAVAHSVHVEVDGLRAGRPYWYRFHAGGATSPVGRTTTFPQSVEQIRFALVSCQNWEHGYFTAYRDIVASNAAFILHVGDYIYERTWGELPYVRPHGLPEAKDLEGYRQRYALYHTDASLQSAHAAVPFIATWDDHEVSNDYANVIGVTGQSPEEFAKRRAAAYQAYFEHMPIRPSIWQSGGGTHMYRKLALGDLLSLHVLDARQYRDVQPCSSPEHRGGQKVAQCAERLDPARTVLGRPQEDWLYHNLRNERAQWTTIAQQMLFANLELASDPDESVWSDFWDGYAANRTRLVNALSTPTVRNAVVLGGDIHSSWVCDVKSDYARPDSAIVGSEFITTCLASRNPATELFGPSLNRNAHVRFMDNLGSGYTLCDVDREHWRAELRRVDSLADQNSACRAFASFIAEDGRPGPRPA
jgi:alkaline phosphatase D